MTNEIVQHTTVVDSPVDRVENFRLIQPEIVPSIQSRQYAIEDRLILCHHPSFVETFSLIVNYNKCKKYEKYIFDSAIDYSRAVCQNEAVCIDFSVNWLL